MPDSRQAVSLADYQPYPFRLRQTTLAFDIHDGETVVDCELAVERDGPDDAPLVLHGAELELLRVAVEGRQLSGNEYAVADGTLTIFDVPAAGRVQIRTRIKPEGNDALEGLYKSGPMYCTQCEPEGFRNITYYPDRPDVLAPFVTRITADAERYPVLLANGNPVGDETKTGRRTVTWEDPFPKPSYLFALVAGDLAVLEDEFATRSGRRVALRIYSEPRNIGQCRYAMGALKRAMRWDEERFGREYDLDLFMIVAVESFNMGAMENKGLNIFNTSYVLASPDTATDEDYQRVEGVVAHEYFHNWSGNRVTCRDWFQLSLKEGFTVYRDAEFSATMHSPTVKRVEDVAFLRRWQFVEDSGPLAHPVRPESYFEIANFYTTTVYEKGAEVVRMLATILGQERFRAGTDAYFAEHDGSAATVEDFVAAMEGALGTKLPQFWRWYDQAGTPLLTVAEERQGDTLRLTVEQSCRPTPGQAEKQPFHIPLAFGLVDGDGRDLLGAAGSNSGSPATVASAARIENPNADGTLVAHLTEPRTTITLRGSPASGTVSFLRGFSAPVRVDYPRSPAALRHLAKFDSDGFARWDAAQSLLAASILGDVPGARKKDPAAADETVGMAQDLVQAGLEAPDDGEAKALLASMLTLPVETWLLELAPGADILAIAAAWDRFADRLAGACDWQGLAEANETSGGYQAESADMARRQLRQCAIWYAARQLDEADPSRAADWLLAMLREANNLTNRLTALEGLLGLRSLAEAAKAEVLDAFYQRWRDEPHVVDGWFTAQARVPLPGTLARVQALEHSLAYDAKVPNKVRALLLAFTGNVRNFHAASGEAYRWAADHVIELDGFNPQMASQLAKVLARWPRFDAARGVRMRAALAAVGDGKLSKNVREVVVKGLADQPSEAGASPP